MSLPADITLGFVGFGKMASALWEGLSKSNMIPPNRVMFYAPTIDTQRRVSLKYGIVSVSLETLAQKSQVIFFCIKPQIAQTVLSQFPTLNSITTPLIVSILAGTPLSLFERTLGKHIPCARLMPNTPAKLGEGAFGLCFNENVTPPYRRRLHELISLAGTVAEIPESQMDLVTALSGSAPAFIYQLTQDVTQFAQKHGMNGNIAKTLFAQTLIGAGKMILESESPPEQLIQDVCSPNGTTMAGLQRYQQENISTRFQNVLEKTAQRAQELSQSSEGEFA